jgi:threonine dehydrogenase-like Zn-dependent dehydrogenase
VRDLRGLRKAKPNCCMNIQVLGVHRDGGMVEYLAVPQASSARPTASAWTRPR